jgi:hypothetical protein
MKNVGENDQVMDNLLISKIMKEKRIFEKIFL